MIVDTMTYEEICQEFEKIQRLYKDRLSVKLNLRKNRRYIQMNRYKGSDCLLPVSCKVDTNTSVHALLTAHSYTSNKAGITAKFILSYINKHGINAVIKGGIFDDFYIVITSHFFNRYNERFLHEKSDSKYDIIFKCINKTDNFIMKPFPIKSNQNNYIGVTEDVITFADRIHSNILLMKTCISSDMLFSNQIKITDELTDDLKDFSKYRKELKDNYLAHLKLTSKRASRKR